MFNFKIKIMKIKNLLVAIAFFMAVGSAFASHFFVSDIAYSVIEDIPNQPDVCIERGACIGGAALCKIGVDHDNDDNTPEILTQMYDGTPDDGESDDHEECGDFLRQP